ncbi:Uncharacterised protein [Mycobacteroides abscessus subsp. abscessus]|nr:Uncharacterised protein [Mycobacteroides abscessus subsp. abscessus]
MHVDQLARLHAEGGAVHAHTVDHDVTVHDHLAGLGDGPGEAGAQHQGIQAGLELLDQVLTGLALGALGLGVGAAHLRLADVVLRAQTLLLAQTHGVVGVLPTTGAPVLAGAVGAALEVLLGLRGQRDPEGAGLADEVARPLGLGGSSQGLPFMRLARAQREPAPFVLVSTGLRDPRTVLRGGERGSAATLAATAVGDHPGGRDAFRPRRARQRPTLRHAGRAVRSPGRPGEGASGHGVPPASPPARGRRPRRMSRRIPSRRFTVRSAPYSVGR